MQNEFLKNFTLQSWTKQKTELLIKHHKDLHKSFKEASSETLDTLDAQDLVPSTQKNQSRSNISK